MRQFIALALVLWATPCPAQTLVEALQKLDVRPGELKQRPSLAERRAEVNRRDIEQWNKIQTKADWEKYRDERIAALKLSLGTFPERPTQVKVVTMKTIAGDGFTIENLVYESRPGLLVTANLYVPEKPAGAMPGLLIIHSHHNPKTQGELQDMGMTWARLGCLVLIPDLLGHGERRQHPFVTSKDFPEPFKVGRQDYFFRYNLGMQLHLIGDSLMGWIVGDLQRGLDVLEQRPGIAKDKLIVLGSVAGGGDPAAVLAALDPRVAAVCPFNFGGPQPETRFPLPDDAETSFNYLGGGSWESTRNLRLSARDGFLPWLIVGSIAPRRLIYAHEFAWDQKRDPVWARLQKVYGLYGADDHLAFAHGRGLLQGQPPEATHCNNIGPEHRKHIYTALKQWFEIPIPVKEVQSRVPAAELQCLTDKAAGKPAHVVGDSVALNRLATARVHRGRLAADDRRGRLREQWTTLLGLAQPGQGKIEKLQEGMLPDGIRWQAQVVRDTRDGGASVPMMTLLPAGAKEKTPIAVAVAHGGSRGFLKHRKTELAQLLSRGVAVCLLDLDRTGSERGRNSSSTSLSASEGMLGRTVLGNQLQELLLVLGALPGQGFGPVGVWGDSFAPINLPDVNVAVPHDAPKQPRVAEPMGGILALLTGLYVDAERVPAIFARGGLVSYRSILKSPFVHVPHDVLVPGVLAVSDLDDVTAATLPRGLMIEAPVDGVNRATTGSDLEQEYLLTLAEQRRLGVKSSFLLSHEEAGERNVADWFVSRLVK